MTLFVRNGRHRRRCCTGWAIGSWFVPILGLFRPKQIANDIWRASDPDAAASQRIEWRERRAPVWLGLWWGAWLVAGFVGRIAGSYWFDSNTPEELQDAARLDLASSLVDIVAAALAVFVVMRLTDRQHRRAARLAVDNAPTVAPSAS